MERDNRPSPALAYPPVSPPVAEASTTDWRDSLSPYARQRIVNKIMETLKMHFPTCLPDGLNEVRRIAVRFEEKIYSAAFSQSDYLRKISLKMLNVGALQTEAKLSAPIDPAISVTAVANQIPTNQGIIYEPVTLNCPNKRLQISPKRSIIDHESCSVSEEDSSTKRMKVSEPVPEKVAREELAFTCPICLCALVTPFSTFCGHVFCEVCIKAATQRQKKCPTCRTKLIGRNAIHRIYIPPPTVD